MVIGCHKYVQILSLKSFTHVQAYLSISVLNGSTSSPANQNQIQQLQFLSSSEAAARSFQTQTGNNVLFPAFPSGPQVLGFSFTANQCSISLSERTARSRKAKDSSVFTLRMLCPLTRSATKKKLECFWKKTASFPLKYLEFSPLSVQDMFRL